MLLAVGASGMLYEPNMIIACPACSTRYAVPDNAIGMEGRTVRCAKCRHSWFQEGPVLEEAVASPAEAVAAEPQRAQNEYASSAPQPAAAPEPVAEPVVEADPVREEAPDEPAPAASYEHDEPASSDASYASEAPISMPDSLSTRTGEDDRPRVYDDAENPSWSRAGEGYSTFEPAAPFRPRRNMTKLLMIAAVLFAVIVLGATAWVWRFGLPGWVPVASTTFAEAQPELVLDFPPNRQDRRTLPNGTEFFGASGTITNVGATERSVPSILIVMRDARERIVYSWEVIPPKRRLAPGESVTINEAVTDVPKSAVAAEIGWKPG
jgi:predicted Zn finger-like uncharacterized protein